MKTKQLRAWMNRYGAIGVLLVGAYLVLHHAWHRRRTSLLLACALMLFLSGWLLFHPKPHHNPPKTQPLIASPPPPSPPHSEPPKLDGPLQDDTDPGPPLPDADGDGVAAINGDLFFAAGFTPRFDGEEETEETPRNSAPCHIYRMHPDGSHRVQLTRGKDEERSLSLSPDGKHLAFWRISENEHERASLCLMDAQGGRITTLLRLPPDCFGGQPFWSPDGSRIAFYSEEMGDHEGVYLLNVARRTHRFLPGIADFAWAPDGRVYERDSAGNARIVHLDTDTSITVSDVIHHALWLDNQTLVGDMPSDWKYEGNLRFINDQGKEIRQLTLHLIGDQDWQNTFDNHNRSWYRLPHHKTTLLLQSGRINSDGSHYGCYRVDTETGKCRLIQNGALVGIAPDGSQVAIAERAWLGSDKRRGAYGPLQIVSLKTGRTRNVSAPLNCIVGGDWQPGPSHRHLTRDQSLLEAIEQGEGERVSTLLAQGASANAHYAEGTTALMLAASDGRPDIVSLLLQHHANVNAADKTGKTALMWAVSANKVQEEMYSSSQQETVLRLHQAGANANATDKARETALMVAAQKGRATLIPLLLQHGSNVDAQNKDGDTALMMAVANCYPHTVQELMKTAQQDLKNNIEDTASSIAHRMASWNREERALQEAEIIAILDRSGARK